MSTYRIPARAKPTSVSSAFKGVRFRAQSEPLVPCTSNQTRFPSFDRHVFRAYSSYSDKNGEIHASYALYDLNSAHEWEAPKPDIDSIRIYTRDIIREFVANKARLTHIDKEDLVRICEGAYICYGAGVYTGFTEPKYYAFWAKIARVQCSRGPEHDYPHFDILLRERAVVVPDYSYIPIGYLCHSPYHLSQKPLYFTRYFDVPTYWKVNKLHEKADAVYGPPAPVASTSSVNTPTQSLRGEGVDESPILLVPAYEPLPFPAPAILEEQDSAELTE